MVKDHSSSERGKPLPPHGLLFPISSKGSFICTIPQTGYHIPRPVLHQSWSTGWNEMKDRSDDPLHHERTLLPRSYISLPEREIAQWVHHEGSIRRPIAPWANALTTEVLLAPGTRNSSMSPPWRINPTTRRTMCERSYHGATSRSRNEK